MFDRYLTEKNLLLLISGTAVSAMVVMYYFFDLALNKYSYLIYTGNGLVKRIKTNYFLFDHSIIGMVVAFVALVVSLLLVLFIKSGEAEVQSPVSVADEDIEQNLTEENEVFYGKGAITEKIIKTFVRHHPESAIKFVFQKNIDGSELDPLISKLHRDWVIRGMTQEIVQKEILLLLDYEKMPDRNLYELTMELRNNIEAKKVISAQELSAQSLEAESTS